MTGPDLDGLSLTEALRRLDERGFRASFSTRPDGRVACLTCDRARHADELPMLAFERVEGASDPADEILVAGLACPSCGARGTLVLPYGARIGGRSSEVLAHLHPPGDGVGSHTLSR